MGPESTGYEMHSLSDFTIDTTGKSLLEMTKKSCFKELNSITL